MTTNTALKLLRIKNIGVISDLEVNFGPGLTILTGETGAGKSMVLSALNLVLGGRAEPDMMMKGVENAVAEAVFDAMRFPAASSIFAETGIHPDNGEYVVRRTLLREGKNRAFVNGSPINIAALKSAGETMVDIHGQHEHQSLLNKDTHLFWLDAYLSLDAQREAFEAAYLKVRRLEAELRDVIKRQEDATTRREFLAFKADELEKADLKEDEEQKLEAEHRLLADAEKIKETGARIFSDMYEADSSVTSRLEAAAKEMEKLKAANPLFGRHEELFRDLAARISDASREINSFCSGMEDDPARFGEVEARMTLLEKLKRKYKTDLKGLLQALAEAKTDLNSLGASAEARDRLEKEARAARLELGEKAAALHKNRTEGVALFKKEVQKSLEEMNMAGAVFDVWIGLEPDEKSGFELDGSKRRVFPHGFGEFQFLVSANPGQPPKPLTKIASGGEISRVMLALKTAVGKTQPVPVLVFDEIDAGIGGKTSDMVGEKLSQLSKNCQIICITHLPQIARQADGHLVVEKTTDGADTKVAIKSLDQQGRVEELARMGAGKVVTDAAREHAKEMIKK
ncbi:MAG: DNA repair protein RecN [Nitrospinae bacterium]|nr:DNA repair protein RecN [Nitrospinota bacterium]